MPALPLAPDSHATLATQALHSGLTRDSHARPATLARLASLASLASLATLARVATLPTLAA